MAGYQSITIVGNVGRSPEFTYLESGSAVVNFNVAVNRTWTDRQSGEKREHTEWFRCTAWKGLAETINRYVSKGMLVMCVGQISGRAYMSKPPRDSDVDPEPRCSLELSVRDIQFLSRGSEDDNDDMDQRPQYEESEYPDWEDDNV